MRAPFMILLCLAASSISACGNNAVHEEPFESPEENTQLRLLFQQVDERDEARAMKAATDICMLPEQEQVQVEAFWGRFSKSPRLARRMGHACMAWELEEGHSARAYLPDPDEVEQVAADPLFNDESSDADGEEKAIPPSFDLPLQPKLQAQPELAMRWYRRALMATDADADFIAAAEIRCDLVRVYEVMGRYEEAIQLASTQMDTRPLPHATQARMDAALARIEQFVQG